MLEKRKFHIAKIDFLIKKDPAGISMSFKSLNHKRRLNMSNIKKIDTSRQQNIYRLHHKEHSVNDVMVVVVH